MTPSRPIPLSASSLSFESFIEECQLSQSLVRTGLERWEGGLGFLVPALSPNAFLPSLWASVSSSLSEGADIDEPTDRFQVGLASTRPPSCWTPGTW